MAESEVDSAQLLEKKQINMFHSSFDNDNFYKNSYNDSKVRSACHVIVNPVSNRLIVSKVDDHLLPSNQSNKQQFDLHPSTICYRTFKNEQSPFNSPLKRSSTFAGVFNTFFKQSDCNSHIQSYGDSTDNKSNQVRFSKSSYNIEDKFTCSEPIQNEYRQLVTSSAIPIHHLLDLQSIKQSLMSMAILLTKHSTSNQGRIIQSDHQSKSQMNSIIHRTSSVNLLNSLKNSPSTTSSSTPSSSLYTNNDASTMIAMQEDSPSFNLNFCALCIQYIEPNEFITLDCCKCGFCRSCLEQYCKIKIQEHSLSSSQITCPSSDCPNSKAYITTEQIRQLVDKVTFSLYEKIKLDLEVHLDPGRVWCPRPNCETVCTVSINEIDRVGKFSSGSQANNTSTSSDPRILVNCKNCNFSFCLHCRKAYHGKMPCQSPSEDESLSLQLSRTKTANSLNEHIKKCPKCGIYIERDKGCAQMMCMSCKHVFCWFCLSSLEEDFLLRHYDSGSCKNKLGHSKGTLLWLRFQVIAVFIGFALFLLLVSPLLLISAPLLLIAHYFCNFSISTKVWTQEDLIDPAADQQTTSNEIVQSKTNSNGQTNSDEQTNNLIDLVDTTDRTTTSNETNKNQQIIQAYIQSNGDHKIIKIDQMLDIENNVLNSNSLFEEHPIELSGYDRVPKEEENSRISFLSWFKRKNSKNLDPPPRLSSMLDVEKHSNFMKEFMASNLSLRSIEFSQPSVFNAGDIKLKQPPPFHLNGIKPGQLSPVDPNWSIKNDKQPTKWWKLFK